METVPIWKSTYYETSAATCEFRILLNKEDEIFHGRAVKSPAEDKIKIRLNQICADYLNSLVGFSALELAMSEGRAQSPTSGYVEFLLQTRSPETGLWSNSMEIAFVNDTSYEEPMEALNSPINGHAAPGQLLPYTCINTSDSAETICITIN